MLDPLSVFCSTRRVRVANGARIAAIVVAGVLSSAVACGSDDDSAGPNDGDGGESASGGARPTGGTGAGGEGGATNDGGGGEVPTDGGGGSSTPGDFSSYWQAESAEVMLFDTQNPTFESQTIEIPAKVPGPGDEREVELYLQFEEDRMITYAYYDGDPAYYRFSQPAYGAGDFYSVSSEFSVHSYTIEDGRLVDTAQQSFGAAWGAITTTTYKELEGDFPPSAWPSRVVSYELGGAQ